MTKYFGSIGYGETLEIRPGVYDDVITERKYYGDVLKNTRKAEQGDKINSDISVGNSISIVADAYAYNHFFVMRYIRWAGAYWIISDVEVQRPRLLLRLGGLYNGPKAEVASDS